MTSHVDRLLARALVAASPPTDISAAEARIAARLTTGRAAGGRGGCADGTGPAAPRPKPAAPGAAPAPPCNTPRAEVVPRPRDGQRQDAADRMAGDLRTLCEAITRRPGALTLLQDLVARRVLEPPGARVLGCVLRLASHPDCAQFWWQFAAGAGDPAAAYCLYLHHMSLGEDAQAHGWLNWWHEEACTQAPPVVDPLHEDAPTDHEMAIALRVLRGFNKERDLPAPVRAVLAYVPRAMDYRDDLELDLPLPEPGFAARIEHLTAAPALATTGSGTAPAGRELLPERRACNRPPEPRAKVEVHWDWRSAITV